MMKAPNAAEDETKANHSGIADGNVNWFRFWKPG